MLIKETISKSLDTLCTKTQIHIQLLFLYLLNILLVCYSCFKDQIADTGKSGPLSVSLSLTSGCSHLCTAHPPKKRTKGAERNYNIKEQKAKIIFKSN